MNQLFDSLLQLITQTSTNMPADVRRVISKAKKNEVTSGRSGQALQIIALNIDRAVENTGPICQDTGMPTFKIHTPVNVNQIEIRKVIIAAIEEATRRGVLRPNSVDSITGKNSGLNIGPGTPVIHFEQWERDDIEVLLLLKGGGCENKNIQYSLPADLEHVGKAGRDLEGVEKCILHAVWQAQGQGCSAGVLGVCIGGDRTSGYAHAKEQLFREMDDVNPDPVLAALEQRIVDSSNTLDIGTMGFGGAVTLLGCKIGVQNRLPASFFVSVAYNCWAYRRLGVHISPADGAISRWLYLDEHPVQIAESRGLPLTVKEIHLQTPLSEENVRKLKVGDVVLLSGPLFTGRDALHKYLMTHDSPVDLKGQAIYHCGPVMLKDEDGKWHVKGAGPTTSAREEPYQGTILRKTGARAVIGKGGMGAKTLEALKEVGAVYLNAIGGAAQFYSDTITDVTGVDLLEDLGVPEAMWHLQVKEFLAIVTMDSHGDSLHKAVEEASSLKLEALV